MKKYKVIYADPPWDYGNSKNMNSHFWGMADKHYKTLKFEDICNLNIQKKIKEIILIKSLQTFWSI